VIKYYSVTKEAYVSDQPVRVAEGFHLRCSFCGKGQNEVKKLVAGPTVCICEECVSLSLGVNFTNEELMLAPAFLIATLNQMHKEGRFQKIDDLFDALADGGVAEAFRQRCTKTVSG
jgi:hypothetical protein